MRKHKIILLLFIMFTLTGCWDKKELEDQAFVIAIGIDKGKEGSISITYDITNPQGTGLSTVGATQKEASDQIISFTAPDIISARDLASANITRTINYAHVKIIILSEEFAKDPKTFTFMESFLRDRQIRRNTVLMVSKESAYEFIKNNNPKMETRIHKYYYFMAQRWKQTGLSPQSNMDTFVKDTLQDSGLFLCIYGTTLKENNKQQDPNNEDSSKAGEVDFKGGNPTQIMGAAVFNQGTMIGTLTGEETRLSLLLRQTTSVDTMLISLQDPLSKNNKLAVRLLKSRPTKINIDVSNHPPKINVKVPVEIDILAIRSDIDYVINQSNQDKLIDGLDKILDKKINGFINKTKKEYGIDPFNWDDIARKKFLTFGDYADYDWTKSYPDAEINVKFDFSIRNFGEEIKPIKIERIRD